MLLLAVLAVWSVTFVVLLFPACAFGRWVAQKLPKELPRSGRVVLAAALLIVWIKFALLVVAVGTLVLAYGQFTVFPHVNSDPRGFGAFLAGVLLFVPAFAAMAVGHWRTRTATLRLQPHS